MIFSYANKPTTLFSKMRAFSRKITFLHIFAKIRKNRTFWSAFYIFRRNLEREISNQLYYENWSHRHC